MIDKEQIRLKIGNLDQNKFEWFCSQLLSAANPEYVNYHLGVNHLGKGTKGTPDAFVKLDNGKYIAFQFTTTNEKNVHQKIMNDITVLNDEKKCFFKNDIEKVVICVNTPTHSAIAKYEEKAKSFGWHLDFKTLDDLVRMAEKSPNALQLIGITHINEEQPHVNNEKYYLCGKRILELRQERNLSPSEFIDLIDFHSERTFLNIEQEESECPLSVIKKIAFATNVETDWLKHGKKDKYSRIFMDYSSSDKLTDYIKENHTNEAFFCINPETMNLYIVLKSGTDKWKKVELSFNMKFWGWFDDFNYIPRIFELIKTLYRILRHNSISVYGRVITNEDEENLNNSNVFIGNIITNFDKTYMYWIEDMFDYKHIYPIDYNRYGDWFIKLHEYFNKYVTE